MVADGRIKPPPRMPDSVHIDGPQIQVRGIEPRTDTAANRHQVGGGHYKDRPIQPWDYVAANGLGFFEGNIIKYVTRWREKHGVEDLRKARHYLDKLIELETQGKPQS